MIARMMLSCPVRHYCISPRSIKTSKLTAIIKAAAKIRLFGYCYTFLTKNIPSIPQEYLCQKAQKRLSLDDLPNNPPHFRPTSSERAEALRRLSLVCRVSQFQPLQKRHKKQESLKSDLKLSCDSDGARTHDPQLRRLLL